MRASERKWPRGCSPHPGTQPTALKEVTVDTPSVDPKTLAGDPVDYAAKIKAQEELYRAAVVAMHLLQSRQQHTPAEYLDGREQKVLRQLRDAIRASS